MDALYQYLLVWTLAATGFPAPEHFATVEITPVEWFANACAPRPVRHCAARAVWIPEQNTIRVADLPTNSPLLRGLLVHEIVHELQHEQYGPALSCTERLRREREAYLAQAAYLAEHGAAAPVRLAQVLKGYRCLPNRMSTSAGPHHRP